MTRFGIITDVHLGSERKSIAGNQAKDLLSGIVEKFNSLDEGLDFVVDLGDRIGNINHAKDLDNLTEYTEIVGSLTPRYLPLLGNHDVYYLTLQENERVLEVKCGLRKVEFNDAVLILLDTADYAGDTPGGIIRAEQFNTLRRWLVEVQKPVWVFSHHVIDDQDISNNAYFNREKKNNVYLSRRKRVRKLFEESGKVRAVFQGHAHWNRLQHQAGIPYFTVGSVSDKGNSPIREPGGCYGVVNSSRDSLEVLVKGRFPVQYKLSRAEFMA